MNITHAFNARTMNTYQLRGLYKNVFNQISRSKRSIIALNKLNAALAAIQYESKMRLQLPLTLKTDD